MNIEPAVIPEPWETPTRHTLPPWEPFRKPIPIALDPTYQRPTLPKTCYDASFGRVHVRPDCRC